MGLIFFQTASYYFIKEQYPLTRNVIFQLYKKVSMFGFEPKTFFGLSYQRSAIRGILDKNGGYNSPRASL